MSTTIMGKITDIMTFSRGSLATVTDSNGYIKWAPHNLLLASEQFDASNWSKNAATVAANTVAAPNGTTTADTIAENTANDVHALSQSAGTLTAENYTYSVFLKYNNLQYVTISFNQSSVSTAWASAIFDIQNGTLASSNASGGPSLVGTPTISSIGSGWYLCSVTANLGSAVGGQVYLAAANTSSGASFRGAQVYTGSSRSFYAWGAHLYRSDLGGMQANASAYPYYNPSTPKNLLGYSEAFDNAAWTKTNTTVTANATIAPNGTTTADELFTTAATAAFIISQNKTIGASSTALIYAKASGTGFFQLSYNGDTTSYANFNLSTGVLGTSTGTVTHSIESVGSGWFKLAVVNTSTAVTGIRWTIVSSAAASRAQTFAGTGAESVYLWGAQLSDSASLDPYVGSYGAAPSPAAAYGPRLDYDPSTLAAKGLLVEEQRTNLVTYSDQLSNVAWTKNGTTVTADAVVGPDGVFSMDKIVATAANVQHNILMPSIANGSAVYTYSFYAKKAEETVCVVDFGGVSTITATFNLDTGTVVSSTGVVASIISAGNGIYRCIATTSTAVDPSAGYRPFIAPRQFTAYAGDGTSGIYIYGAQLEAASFATSYIPTAAATVTRNADVAFVATSQFPYSATEGTLVLAADVLATTSANRFGALLSSPSNFIGVGNNIGGSGGVYAEFFVSISGVTQAYLAFNNAVAANTLFKVAGSYKADDFAASANGATALTDTTGSVPTDIDTLQIGRYYSSSYFNGHIRQITYIPRRLTNAELQQRTA